VHDVCVDEEGGFWVRSFGAKKDTGTALLVELEEHPGADLPFYEEQVRQLWKVLDGRVARAEPVAKDHISLGSDFGRVCDPAVLWHFRSVRRFREVFDPILWVLLVVRRRGRCPAAWHLMESQGGDGGVAGHHSWMEQEIVSHRLPNELRRRRDQLKGWPWAIEQHS
jgi:hypothetical protein